MPRDLLVGVPRHVDVAKCAGYGLVFSRNPLANKFEIHIKSPGGFGWFIALMSKIFDVLSGPGSELLVLGDYVVRGISKNMSSQLCIPPQHVRFIGGFIPVISS